MKDSQKRTCCDISLIHQDEFHDFCRNGKSVLFYKEQKNAIEGSSVYHDQPEGDYFEHGTAKLYENCTSENGNIKAWLFETAYEAEPAGFL